MGNRFSDTIREIPVIQIRPNAIIEYLEPVCGYYGHGGESHIEEANKAKEEAYSGELKDAAAKRLKKAVNLLVMSSEKGYIYNPVTQKQQYFQIAFITLTISSKYQLLTASEAHKRLLEPFLQWLRRVKKCNSYIWKAELQARGQIHYHITLGRFILFNEIRDKWNYLQRQAGLLEDYYEENKHYNPNSTDVHSVKGIRNICSYLCKYIAKEQSSNSVMKAEFGKEQPLKEAEVWGNLLSCYPINNIRDVRTVGKVWDCSNNLKKGKYYTTGLSQSHESILEEALKNRVSKLIKGGRYKIHLLGKKESTEVLSEIEKDEFKRQMRNIQEDILIEGKKGSEATR